MENISDVYSSPEVTECNNPIHNENIDINRLTLIEESLNKSLNNNRTELVFNFCARICTKLFLFIFLSFLIIVLTVVILVALKKANLV